ncbi:RHS repeat-associated core domain-containing protein [Streptomyces sp. ALI-76-A]|uniref:RHS repeat-associated core domain-containing protein n=1 Tax=Streptomyces sp. ALI-76-A TaxID=3025736 RepID=UPI00256EE172|nr:RHS repeat-associated core domain-containing protein [Streptomyces sp. ALI-76-A]MDL5206043.1 RHS repeat-associated core domain-containing protein [Streptomyces sp. ALI-76-A]
MPPVRVGVTRPPRSLPSSAPDAGERAWQQREERRLRGQEPAPSRSGDAEIERYVPQGQGAVPWHQISDFRVTDALVGRIDYSTGNFMLAATDFDIAGVGQSLQLTRTYNSLDAPYGQVDEQWWLGYERRLDLSFTNEVLHYDDTGATVEYARNADGTFTTPSGYSKDLRGNADGTYTLTDRSSGLADTYGADGRLTKVSDRNNGSVTVTAHQDSSGAPTGFRLTETRSGRWIDLTRTSSTKWQAKDNGGRTAGYELDAGTGRLTRTVDTEGEATTFAYDGDGRLVKLTTSESRSAVLTYDGQDRVTSLRRYSETGGGSGPTYAYSYTGATPHDAGVTTVTDPLGHTSEYHHNADGEVTKTVDGLKHERSKTYKDHLVQTATDAMGTGNGGPGGNVTTYGWDTRNNPTSAKLPTGATATGSWQTIAGADVPSTANGPDGEKTEFTYDTAGNTRTVTTTGTGGGTRTFTHNEATPTCGGFQGQTCSASDANNKKTSFRYDGQGNLITATPPAPQNPTTYTYDALGRTATATDGRGVKTVYTYDDRDRVTKVTTPQSTVSYLYDGDGNLTSRTDVTGVQTYRFDALSRETIRTLQDGSQTVLAYTADGNVDTYTDPGGVTDYEWDAANRLTVLTGPTNKKTAYEYDNNDARTKTTYPGGTVQSVTLDNSGRPQNIRNIAPSGRITSDLSYTYAYTAGTESLDGVKIRSLTDNLTRTRTAYQYDSAGRASLAEEIEASGRKTSWQYCHDPAGNLLSQGAIPGCPGATVYTYDDASQLIARNGITSNWSYDKAGNETAGAPTPEATRTAEQYTDFSQLKSLTVGGTTYGAQYASTDSSERTRLGGTVFHNGPLGLSGQTVAGKDTEFIREPGGTLNSLTTGGKNYYYLTDALGSVTGLVDESGKQVNTYRYTPTGISRTGTTESVPQPYRFTGGYQDPTGLYHFGARYYDPQISRFTQPDPSGQEKNPYLYAEGDPLNRIDPSGTYWVLDTIGDILDVKSAVQGGMAAQEGNYKKLWGIAAGAAVGAAAQASCTTLAGAAGLATGGVGFLAAAGCLYLGDRLGNHAEESIAGG